MQVANIHTCMHTHTHIHSRQIQIINISMNVIIPRDMTNKGFVNEVW